MRFLRSFEYLKPADFDFELPKRLIAQQPVPERDGSRLLVLHRASKEVTHQRFRDLLQYLRAGDVLVLNNSKVIPARLRGLDPRSGGKFEALLLTEEGLNDWWAMLKPGKRARIGTQINFFHGKGRFVQATVTAINPEGHRRLEFVGIPNIGEILDEVGEIPLPPYINRAEKSSSIADRERYQTVFAKTKGSVAAPTAGLHFTEPLLERIQALGVKVCFVTLHVGLGTFAPVKAESFAEHKMHEERYVLSEAAASTINLARKTGHRVFAVGTTTIRALESAALDARRACSSEVHSESFTPLGPTSGKTRIFIYPPYDFKIADALLTNFHLPRSTLLMLVSAFAAPNESFGRELILSAYAQAISANYRFFSYGDAMLIL